MPLQADAIGDFLVHTLKTLGRGKFEDLVSQYPEYVLFTSVLRSRQREEEGGYGSQRNVLVNAANNAVWTGLHATESTNVVDGLKTISVPHRIAKSSWAVDEIALAMNSGSFEKIVDLLIELRVASDIKLADLVEAGLASKPADSADESKPYGFPYWLVYNAAEGFNGGHPAGFSNVAGLSGTTFPNWKNYTAKFTNYTEDDLFDKLRMAMDKCNFMPPTEVPEGGKGMDWELFTDYTNKNEFIKAARAQNESLGAEVLKNPSGVPVVNGTPLRWVPAFEDTTIINASSQPIYGINWRTWELTGLKGWRRRESPPMIPYNQPTVRIMYTHMIMNLLCRSRRRNFLIAKAEPTP